MHSQCQFFHSFSVIFFSQASDINFTPVSPNRKFRFLASLCTKVYEKGDMHFENWELNVGKRTKNSIRKFKQFCCQKGVDKKARRQHKTNAKLVSKFWQPCRHSLWNPHQKDRCSDVCVWQSHPPGSGCWCACSWVVGVLGGGGDWEGSLPEKCLPAPFALPAGSLSTVPFAAGGAGPVWHVAMPQCPGGSRRSLWPSSNATQCFAQAHQTAGGLGLPNGVACQRHRPLRCVVRGPSRHPAVFNGRVQSCSPQCGLPRAGFNLQWGRGGKKGNLGSRTPPASSVAERAGGIAVSCGAVKVCGQCAHTITAAHRGWLWGRGLGVRHRFLRCTTT